MNDFALANSSNGAEKRLERAKRRAILFRIIEESDKRGKKLTYDDMAAKMREDRWVAARWPTYAPSSAQRDFTKVMALVEDDIRALALPYLARNINLADEAIDRLVSFSRDSSLSHKLRIDSLNAMLRYIDHSDKIFGNFAAKEMHIKKAELQMDLDSYMKMTAAAQRELEAIDGVFIEHEQDVDNE